LTTSTLINPATEEELRTVELARRARRRRRDRPREVRAEAMGQAGAAERAAACDRSPPWWMRTSTKLAALEVSNSGHVIGNAEWEAGHVRDVLQFYSASPERMSGKQIPGRRTRRHVQRATRRRRRHRAVELPDDHRVMGLRARHSPRATRSW